jgi:hypothetical protein
MAHYALLDENNVVVNVLVGRNEDEVVDEIIDWEEYYGNFHNMKCKRTSYNTHLGQHRFDGTPFRKNYAQVGGTYDEERDAFIPIKYFESWIFDEDTCAWKAPIPQPDNDHYYRWNEETLSWDNFGEKIEE